MKQQSLKEEKFTLTYNFTDYPYPHSHNFWEFTLITDGTIMHKINDSSVVLNKNTLLVLRPKDRHMFFSISPQSSHINFTVPSKVMETQMQLLLPNAYQKLLEDEAIALELSELNCQKIIQLTLKAEAAKKKQGDEPYNYDSRLSQLFLVFIDELLYRIFIHRGNLKPDYNFLPEHLKIVISLLNDTKNFSKSLQNILKEIPYSYVHISKSFKQYMHMSLSDYFLTIKMNHAKLMLEKGNTSILSVSEEIGYTKQSHFNLAFKKFFHTTPLQYKKNWQEYYSSLEDTQELLKN